MALSSFRVNIVLRVVLLLLLAGVLMYCALIQHWVITSILVAAMMVGVVYQLSRFVEQTNREFTTFLQAIRSNDFSRHSLKDASGKSFVDFRKAMNDIISEFQETRVEKEAHFMYLQAAVEHMTTAILSFDKDGRVKLINQQAKQLLDCPGIRNITALKQINGALYDFLTSNNVFSKQVLEIQTGGERQKLSVRCTDFNIQGVEHRLVSIQNIRPEIEDTEMEAWERLLRVLTHEIMNSITPLSSLSETLKNKSDRLLAEREFDEEALEDLSSGLAVIAKRSSGLINFINHYRTFTTLPAPELRPLNVNELIARVADLKRAQLQEKNIAFRQDVSDSAGLILGDAGQIEQVLINLVNNAMDALSATPDAIIAISADAVNGKTGIRVTDNGSGIDRENLERIFIPFFSTKSNGMGIGLSLSKQIMRMHGGSISASSVPGQTVFSLVFQTPGP